MTPLAVPVVAALLLLLGYGRCCSAELCPPAKDGKRPFGFYYSGDGYNRTTTVRPDLDVLGEQWEVKRGIVVNASREGRIAQHELCGRPPQVFKWGTGEETLLAVLAALWAPPMPMVELLVWLGSCNPSRFMNQCVSQVPYAVPTCVFPGGAGSTRAKVLWPIPRHARQYGHPVRVTTVRFFCPLPEGFAPPSGEGGFELQLRTDENEASLGLCRRTRSTGAVVACPQPLWGYHNMSDRYPNLVHEWLAYHRLIGFDRFHIYDLFGEFDGPLKDWERSGFLQVFPQFPAPFLVPPRHGNMAGREYCTEGMAHDHCLFANQLSMRWGMLLHAPDNFLTFRNSAADTTTTTTTDAEEAEAPTGVKRLLSTHDSFQQGELLVMTWPCGGPKQRERASILLTFTSCGRVLYGRRETPILSTLMALSTEVHIVGTMHPALGKRRRKELVDPLQVATAHFMQMFPRSQHRLANATRQQQYLVLHDWWPKVNELVLKVQRTGGRL